MIDTNTPDQAAETEPKFVIWSSRMDDSAALSCKAYPSYEVAEQAVKVLLENRPRAVYYIARLVTMYQLGDKPILKRAVSSTTDIVV